MDGTMDKRLLLLPCNKNCTKKPNESRPLSLVHACFSFVMSYGFKNLANTLEESGVFSNDINAYRPGFSAEEIPNTMVFKMQEATETGKMIAIVAEDEERYFNRATPEIQHIAIKASECLIPVG